MPSSATCGLPEPHHHLGVGSGSHAEQTARVMMAYEPRRDGGAPGLVAIVVGDVNSTAGRGPGLREAGHPHGAPGGGPAQLRPQHAGGDQPPRDGRARGPAVDALAGRRREPAATRAFRPAGSSASATSCSTPTSCCGSASRRTAPSASLGLEPRRYGVVTLHRPSNVDDPATLGVLVEALARVSPGLPLVFSVHPRTRKDWLSSASSRRWRRQPACGCASRSATCSS